MLLSFLGSLAGHTYLVLAVAIRILGFWPCSVHLRPLGLSLGCFAVSHHFINLHSFVEAQLLDLLFALTQPLSMSCLDKRIMCVDQDFVQVTAIPLHHILVGQELSDIKKLIDYSLLLILFLATTFLFRLSLRHRLGLALCRVLVL